MIDTDKYEGHTPAPWWMPSMELRGSSQPVVKMATFKREPSFADRILIADAPLLLAEVKWSRDRIERAISTLRSPIPDDLEDGPDYNLELLSFYSQMMCHAVDILEGNE
jgi:hypothetical protein